MNISKRKFIGEDIEDNRYVSIVVNNEGWYSEAALKIHDGSDTAYLWGFLGEESIDETLSMFISLKEYVEEAIEAVEKVRSTTTESHGK